MYTFTMSPATARFPLEAPATARHPFRDVRLHVVTGKGGTGKTTVAAAIAIALAAGGRRVLLAETEGRQGIAQLFDCPPLPYEERKVASAPGAGEVFALAIDPEEALLEYLEMFYNMRRAGRTLKRIGAIDFATTIAPGMRDVLLTGKVNDLINAYGTYLPGYGVSIGYGLYVGLLAGIVAALGGVVALLNRR